jgi:hypothetical protein
MDLQLFYRDTEQVDNWMSKQEVMCTGTLNQGVERVMPCFSSEC